MKKRLKAKWAVFYEDSYVLIVPESDIKPHGFPNGKKKAVLAGIDCPCKPKINMSCDKPIIIHNSFEEKLKIEESMKELLK